MPNPPRHRPDSGPPVRRPGRPKLPIERIVGTALLLVDESGADALTLRSLAARLGSSTATLYRHFPGRDELVRAVVDSMFAEVALTEQSLAGMHWDAALLDVAGRMFDVLERHRKAAPLLLEEWPTGTHAVMVREMCLSALRASGFEPGEAVRVYATVARFVLGFGVQASAARLAPVPSMPGSSIGSVALKEEFEYGLHLMVDGLRIRHGRLQVDA